MLFALCLGGGFIIGYNGAFNFTNHSGSKSGNNNHGSQDGGDDNPGGGSDNPGGGEDNPGGYEESPSEKLIESITSEGGLIVTGDIDIKLEEDLDFHIDLNAKMDITDIEDLKINADALFACGAYTIDTDIAYYNNNITIDSEDNHIKFATKNFLDIFDMLPTLGIDLNVPEKFKEIDLMSLAIQLGSLKETDKKVYPDGKYYFPFTVGDMEVDLITDSDSRDRLLGVRLVSYSIGQTIISGELNLSSFNNESLTIVNPLEGEDADKYVDFNQAIGLIETISKIAKQDRFRIEFNGLYNYKSLDTTDITYEGGFQFDIKELFGYGKMTLVDSGSTSHVIKADMKSPEEILFSYNNDTSDDNSLKGKFNTQTLKELIELLETVINNPDKHFVELFSDIASGFSSEMLDGIIDGDYTLLVENKIIDNLLITDGEIEFDINLGLLELPIGDTCHLSLTYHENTQEETMLDYLTLTGLDLGQGVLSFSATLKEFDQSQEIYRLNGEDTYLDFSDIKILLELGIETSKFEYFHIKGKFDLSLLGGLYDPTIYLDIKVRNVDGNVQLQIEITSINTVVGINREAWKDCIRNAELYYANGFFYVHRSDYYYLQGTKENYSRRFTWDYFLDNAVSIFCKDIIGLNDKYMAKVQESQSDETKPISYEDILKNFVLTTSEDGSEHYFEFTIDMKELTNKDNFGDLTLKAYEDAEQIKLNKLEINFTIYAGITLNFSATLELQDDTSVELTDANRLTLLEAYIEAHQNDPLYEWISF